MRTNSLVLVGDVDRKDFSSENRIFLIAITLILVGTGSLLVCYYYQFIYTPNAKVLYISGFLFLAITIPPLNIVRISIKWNDSGGPVSFRLTYIFVVVISFFSIMCILLAADPFTAKHYVPRIEYSFLTCIFAALYFYALLHYTWLYRWLNSIAADYRVVVTHRPTIFLAIIFHTSFPPLAALWALPALRYIPSTFICFFFLLTLLIRAENLPTSNCYLYFILELLVLNWCVLSRVFNLFDPAVFLFLIFMFLFCFINDLMRSFYSVRIGFLAKYPPHNFSLTISLTYFLTVFLLLGYFYWIIMTTPVLPYYFVTNLVIQHMLALLTILLVTWRFIRP